MFLSQQLKGPWHRIQESRPVLCTEAGLMDMCSMDRCSFRPFHSHLQAHRPAACHVCYSHKPLVLFLNHGILNMFTGDKGPPGLFVPRFSQNASVQACTEACHVREGFIYERGLKHKLVSFTDFSSSGHATLIPNRESSSSSSVAQYCFTPPDGSIIHIL